MVSSYLHRLTIVANDLTDRRRPLSRACNLVVCVLMKSGFLQLRLFFLN